MDALLQTLDKLLTRKVCDATTKALEKLAQAFNRQQKSIAELREEVRSLGERVRVLPDREPSLSRSRLSAHDIKVFRKRRHLTQEVFAQMLHVSKQTVLRWEKEKNAPNSTQRAQLRRLKLLDKIAVEQEIQKAKKALYE